MTPSVETSTIVRSTGSEEAQVSGDNAGKAYHETSVFIAENLLREARRQRGLGDEPVPDVCVLDPDGDIVRTCGRRAR